MSKSEYIAPAVQRLLDLCTNGLFVNLRDFPEPMKNTYQHLREAVRGGLLAGAELALIDMVNLCLQFPTLMACSIMTGSLAEEGEKQEIYRKLNAHTIDGTYCMDTLIPALKAFFLRNPDENAALFLSAAEDLSRRVRQQDLMSWCRRLTSGCVLEINRSETASELITYIDLLNQHLKQVLHFYVHVKEKQEVSPLTFDCLGTEVVAEPWMFRDQDEIFLLEKIDAPSGKMFCRGQNGRGLRLFAAPEECALFHARRIGIDGCIRPWERGIGDTFFWRRRAIWERACIPVCWIPYPPFIQRPSFWGTYGYIDTGSAYTPIPSVPVIS